MRIGLNISTVSGDLAGVGHYAFQLACHVPIAAPDTEWVFFGPDPAMLPTLARHNVRVKTRSVPKMPRVLWEQTALPLAAFREETDLLHGTDFSRPVIYGRRTINTIHDLSPFADPRFFPVARRVYKRALIPLAASRCTAIITVSQFSLRQIVARFPALEGRVFVIHHGVETVQHDSLPKAEADHPFLLFVGTLENRKNLVTLIRVFCELRERLKLPLRLVLAGKPGFGWGEIKNAISASKARNAIVAPGYVSKSELLDLYRSASLFVYPSFYEGFGLPVLEAMAHGTPVACSNATSLPEVGGDAVAYFNPHNGDEMAATIERVLDSPSLQAEMREKGYRRSAQFTWEKCAREHVKVYRKVLAL